MITYAEAGDAAVFLVAAVLKKHHPELHKAKLTVCTLFAHAARDEKTGQPKGPALKHHGYQAAAIIAVVPLDKRVGGMADVLLKIDGDRWPEWSEAQREALIDHELEHVGTDDAGRPKVKLRLHDWNVQGFKSIAVRHKDAAFEVQEAQAFHKEYAQLLFPWG